LRFKVGVGKDRKLGGFGIVWSQMAKLVKTPKKYLLMNFTTRVHILGIG